MDHMHTHTYDVHVCVCACVRVYPGPIYKRADYVFFCVFYTHLSKLLCVTLTKNGPSIVKYVFCHLYTQLSNICALSYHELQHRMLGLGLQQNAGWLTAHHVRQDWFLAKLNEMKRN